MEMRLTVVSPQRQGPRHQGGGLHELVVDVPDRATVADLIPALAVALGLTADDVQALYTDGRALPPATPLGVPPLLEGAVVGLCPTGTISPTAAPGLLEVHVVGGPDSGSVFRLSPGTHRVGRAAEATVRVEDRALSRVHAELQVTTAGVRVRDLGSTNGTWLDGSRLGGAPRTLAGQSHLDVGSSTLVLRTPFGQLAATHPDGAGHLCVNRRPRIHPPAAVTDIRLPAPPTRREGSRLPVIATALPLALAVVMWRVLDSPTMLLFGLMSPVMLVGSWVSERRLGRAGWARSVADHAAALAAAEQALDVALRLERDRRRLRHPDHAELLRTVTAPLSRLWERRRVDDDFLSLSVGTGTVASETTVTDGARDPQCTPQDLHRTPVAVPLVSVGVLGIAGPREEALGVARALVAEVCGWHSPRDVSLELLCASAETGRDWTWVAHLPHTRPGSTGGCRNLVGLLRPDSDQVQRRVAELTTLVRTRSTMRGIGRERWDGPRCVVLLDGAQRLRALPGVSGLLRDGPDAGVHFLCLDTEGTRLPVECGAVVQVSPGPRSRITLAVNDAGTVDDVVPDAVSDRWAHRFARALAPLRDATPDDAEAEVPDAARLLDLLAPAGLTPHDVARRWRDRPRSTSAMLGVAAAGGCVVDLRRDGPHALVGGTTGAGKSELLQTMIASLAIGNRPDEMAFVLVDYKGGSAFKDCARLPHTVGLVTDLDGHLTARALDSLEAELTRRERLLGRVGAKDIEDYQATAGPDDPRLPRLVLVIDEFKMLAEELPGFVDGLVRIAAVGRSLGIHLVLATQRPGGIVSADIKANVNLRIALRVRDTVDSEDVIDSPAAQAIPERTPGRAYLRSGAQPLVAFQTARVGGRCAPRGGDPVTVHELAWETLGDPPPSEPACSSPTGPTDLAAVVAATTGAARQMAIAPIASPWLPPLPDLVDADTLEAPAWQVPYALADLPRQQVQRPVTWDLENGGHLAVAGAGRTGRTSFLRTLGGTLAARFSPADVHLYGFDGSAGALQALTRLPHTGAVVHRDDAARCDRLVSRLLQEVRLRQLLLAQQGFASVEEQRRAASAPRRETGGEPSAGPPLPYLVLLLDGWQELATSWEFVDHGRPVEALLRVLREGRAVGVRAALTGDRSVLLSRVGSVVADRLVLRMADSTDLLMAGISGDAVPSHQPAGRAVRVGDSVEMQLALLGGGTDGPGQNAALEAIGLTATSTWDSADGHAPESERRPFRVEALPTDVSVSQLRGTPSTAAPVTAHPVRPGDGHQDQGDDGQADGPAGLPLRVVLGAGGDELDAIVSADVGQGANTLVAGPARSGRSTTLLTIATQLLAAGRPLVVLTTRRSPLTGLTPPDHSPAEASRAGDCRPGDSPLALLGPSDADPLAALLAEHPALVAVVDDAELFLDTPVEDHLLGIARRAEATGGGVVCAGSTSELSSMFRGLTVEVRKRRLGLLLNPSGYTDGDLFGIRVGGRDLAVPGRGLFVDGSTVIPLQAATPH